MSFASKVSFCPESWLFPDKSTIQFNCFLSSESWLCAVHPLEPSFSEISCICFTWVPSSKVEPSSLVKLAMKIPDLLSIKAPSAVKVSPLTLMLLLIDCTWSLKGKSSPNILFNVGL